MGKSVPLSRVSLLRERERGLGKAKGTPTPAWIEELWRRKGSVSPKVGIPPASSALAFDHTCDSVLSPPGGSCSGYTVPGSSHNVSPVSHPSSPACEYAPALSSASQSRSDLGFPLHSKARGQPGAWGGESH